MKSRLYYFNIYLEGDLLGSVKATDSLDAVAKAISTANLEGTVKAKRVSSTEAGEPLEEILKNRGEITPSEEKEPTEAPVSDQEEPTPKKFKATEKQLQAYANLKPLVAKWDNSKYEDVRTKYTMNENGLMVAKTMATTKTGTVRKRELLIGRNGGIRAYGKKPRGTKKLMVALKDVIEFCYTEKNMHPES